MNENRSRRTDLDVADEFDRLFNEVPEPATEEDIRQFLSEAGYDFEKLKVDGRAFINDLIASNWRFADSQTIKDAVAKIDETPVRTGWSRVQLQDAIEKFSVALASHGTRLSLEYRNLEDLTDADLASILQELEYKARTQGIDPEL